MIDFKGYDWTELLKLKKEWPETPSDLSMDGFIDEESARASYLLTNYLTDILGSDETEEFKYVCNNLRHFLTTLAGYGGYSSQVYLAIAGIKHDQVMLSWVVDNLERFWI